MDKDHKQSIIRELIKEVKGDYKVPGRLFAWGLVVGQWMTIIIIGSIFLTIFAYFIMMGFQSSRNIEPKSTNNIQSITDQKKTGAKQKLASHLEEITKFMQVSAESVNDRQAIVEELTEVMSSYAGQLMSPDTLENKQKRFSSILSTCNQYRGRYMNKFANEINPFDDPHISDAYKKLIHNPLSFDLHVCNPQEENKRWEALCEFCRQEATKANNELTQVLQGGEVLQTTGKSEK